mgnify:CR=1 FL=1
MQERNYSIKSWAKDDRPREKLLSKSPISLSDAELLSLVCANQQYPAKQDALLERTWRWHQKDWRTLAKSSEWDLLEIYGIEPQMARWIITGTPSSARTVSPNRQAF